MFAAWLATGLWAGAAPATAQEIYAARVNGAGITLKEVEAGFDEMLKDKGMHLLQVISGENRITKKIAIRH